MASSQKRPFCEIRTGSLNVGTMEGKALEVVNDEEMEGESNMYRTQSGEDTGR